MRSLIIQKRTGVLFLRAFCWHLRYLLGRPTKPLSAGMYITNTCNFRCSFCNIWRKRPQQTISEDMACHIVEELGKNNCFYFSISGGEPLLVPYLPKMLRRAKEFGVCYTHVVTNGFLLTKEKARALCDARLDEISISLDGPPCEHDVRRGMNGAYNGVMRAVDNLRSNAPNVDIVLNSILSPEKPANCLHAIKKAEEMGLRIKIQPYNLHPDFDIEGETSADERKYIEKNRDELKMVIEHCLKSSAVVNSGAFLRAMNAYFFDGIQTLFKKHDECVFGYHHIEFSEKGKVFPCLEGMNWENGFEASAPLSDILKNKKYTDVLSSLRNCEQCRKSMYVCYYEPRISFPLGNLLKYMFA